MLPFKSHRLIKGKDGDILILYLDFSVEFAGPLGSLEKDAEKGLEKSVLQYISRYLPNSKVKLAYVASGSLLLAALSLSPAGDAAATAPKPAVVQKHGEPQKENAAVQPEQKTAIPVAATASGIYRPGDSGAAVESIQQVLAALGYKLDATGVYDDRTEEVLYNFQKRYPDIKADGTYNNKTREYLDKLIYTPFRIISNPNSTMVLVNKMNSLSYDYVPPDLTTPNVPTSYKKPMRKEAAQAYEALFFKAQQEGILLHAVSGYRSYDRQADLFAETWSSDMDTIQYRARPGESEHQTGLAVDVTADSVGNQLTEAFASSPEGRWLAKNAADFGFIIRYPKEKENITGYHYEPWHIRYVGVEAAKRIAENHLTLEEYLE